jgi:hypothetical protein
MVSQRWQPPLTTGSEVELFEKNVPFSGVSLPWGNDVLLSVTAILIGLLRDFIQPLRSLMRAAMDECPGALFGTTVESGCSG